MPINDITFVAFDFDSFVLEQPTKSRHATLDTAFSPTIVVLETVKVVTPVEVYF